MKAVASYLYISTCCTECFNYCPLRVVSRLTAHHQDVLYVQQLVYVMRRATIRPHFSGHVLIFND
jgi:hypothetical protein